jgi:hypothetical protein
MTDRPHDLLAESLRRLHDVADVLTAISAASRLLIEQLDQVELEVMALAKMAADNIGDE